VFTLEFSYLLPGDYYKECVVYTILFLRKRASVHIVIPANKGTHIFPKWLLTW